MKSLTQLFLKLNTSKLDGGCLCHEVPSLSTSQTQPHATIPKQTGVLLLTLHFPKRGCSRVSLLWWSVHGQSTSSVLLSFNPTAILLLRVPSAVMYRLPSFLGLAWNLNKATFFSQSYFLAFLLTSQGWFEHQSSRFYTISRDVTSAFFQRH